MIELIFAYGAVLYCAMLCSDIVLDLKILPSWGKEKSGQSNSIPLAPEECQAERYFWKREETFFYGWENLVVNTLMAERIAVQQQMADFRDRRDLHWLLSIPFRAFGTETARRRKELDQLKQKEQALDRAIAERSQETRF